MDIHQNIFNFSHDNMHDFYQNSKQIMQNKLTILQINARSSANMETFDEIKHIVNQLNDIDIIIISETWFKKGLLHLYDIPDYAGTHL